MTLYHLIDKNSQIGSKPNLYHLTTQNDLESKLDLFLLTCKVDRLSPRTLCDYQYKITRFLKFCSEMGDTRVPPYLNAAAPIEITATHVRMFLLKFQEKQQAVSALDYYKVLKRFFNWMVEEEILQASPMAKIRTPRVPEKLIKPFTQEYIVKLLELCNPNIFLGARNRAIILTLLDTGLRLSELASIQLKDVDFDQEIISVMGKGARQRIVRIGRTAQKALLRYLLMRKDSYPCLWVSEEGRPLWASGIAQVFTKKFKYKMDFQGIRCSAHTLRHTCGTQALLNGATEREVQLLLGHKTSRMTRHYTATITSEHAVKGHRTWSPVDKMHLK